jgi:hypothetical protein
MAWLGSSKLKLLGGDRRAAEVPSEAIDQLVGWSSVSNIGSRYGQGYSVEHLRRYMDLITIK